MIDVQVASIADAKASVPKSDTFNVHFCTFKHFTEFQRKFLSLDI